MDKIPLEVFTNITYYLSYKEKLTLLLVSRHWHDMIKSTNLFNSFKIKGEKHFQTAIAYFENHNEYVNQVRNLSLIKPSTNAVQILHVPTLFPHLQTFFYADYSNDKIESQSISEETVHSWQHITCFEEVNRHPLSGTLLRSGMFNNLTKIKINFHFKYNKCKDLFPYLSNAPKLNRLEVSCVRLSLHTMEILHEKAPQLETLYLTDIMQEEQDFDLNYEIEQDELSQVDAEDWGQQERLTKPAQAMTHLRIRHMKKDDLTFGLESRWMTYIAKKYVHLKSLVIDGVNVGNSSQPYYEPKLVEILNVCKHLKMYKLNIYPLTSPILDIMDKNHIQLKEIDILNDLDQLQHLVRSDQKDFIQHIMIKTDQINIETITTYLQQFSNLTHLVIESSNKRKKENYVPIDTLISRLNKLKSISLLSCDVGLKGYGEVVSQLESLELEKVLVMDNAMMDFISRWCPGLDKLKIHGQVHTKTDSFNIHFENQYFSSIRVLLLGNEYYRVDNGNQTLWYKFRGRQFQRCDNILDQFYVSIKYKGMAALNIGGVNIPKW